MRWFAFCLILLSAGCVSSDLDLGQGPKIRGFTQFDIYRGDNPLGFAAAGENRFNFRVWEGGLRTQDLKQTIQLEYNHESGFDFGASLAKLFSAGVDLTRMKSIQIKLINPREISLENPYPALQFAHRLDFLETKYVSSVLKVEKISLSMESMDGIQLSGSAVLQHITPSAGFDLKETEKSVFIAENCFVGYKLSDPPKNAKDLRPFELEYQVLVRDGGWRLLDPHDSIKESDALKIKVRANHPIHLYLFNHDSGGNVHLLFPNEKIGYLNPLQGGQWITFPEQEELAFIVDDVQGVEVFEFLVFREKNRAMADLLKKVQRGIKRKEFDGNEVVIRTKGCGTIKKIKMDKKKSGEGLDLPAHRIQGLPSDFKISFVLRHE